MSIPYCGVRLPAVLVIAANISFAQAFPEGSLMSAVSRAKAQNRKVVHLTPLINHAAAYDFDTATQKATVVLADLVAEATTYDTYLIYTWQKFRIRERLGPYQNTPRRDGDPPDYPKSLLPIQSDEFVIVEPFGTVEIAGVKVISDDESVRLPASETRLMFVQFFQDAPAGLQFGHFGVFSVMPDGILRAKIDSARTR
jgi:hypothetical protein